MRESELERGLGALVPHTGTRFRYREKNLQFQFRSRSEGESGVRTSVQGAGAVARQIEGSVPPINTLCICTGIEETASAGLHTLQVQVYTERDRVYHVHEHAARAECKRIHTEFG
jgi:hypothetical protein